jgi:hypothetical protein
LRQRPSIHVPDEACLIGGIALIVAAVPVVMWSVEIVLGLFR